MKLWRIKHMILPIIQQWECMLFNPLQHIRASVIFIVWYTLRRMLFNLDVLQIYPGQLLFSFIVEVDGLVAQAFPEVIKITSELFESIDLAVDLTICLFLFNTKLKQ